MVRFNCTFGVALLTAFFTLVGPVVAGEASVSVSFTGEVVRAESYADEKLPMSVVTGSKVAGTIEFSGSDEDRKNMRQYDGVSWMGIMKTLTFDGAFAAKFSGGNLIVRTSAMELRTANCEGVCSADGPGIEAMSSDSQKLVFVPSGFNFTLVAFKDSVPNRTTSMNSTVAAMVKMTNSGKAKFVVRFTEKNLEDPLMIIVSVKSMELK